MNDVKIIEHSISEQGIQLVTFQLRYQRFIHSELMTHRVFSRCASSSRAVPVAKMLEQVRNNPAMPLHWGANQPGMQANGEVDEAYKVLAQTQWRIAAERAAHHAEMLAELGLHKQVCNRLLEPFQFMHVVVSSTEWDNFFELRDHPAAEPNFQSLARKMRETLAVSTPTFRPRTRLNTLGWHLPYISMEERLAYDDDPFMLAKVSTARCARVSYMNHDGSNPDISKDLELANRLIGSRPMHASPCEHQAYPAATALAWSGNFRGWSQHRKWVEMELREQVRTPSSASA